MAYFQLTSNKVFPKMQGYILGFPCGTVVKNLIVNAGYTRDVSLILGSGRSLGVGNGNPLQYSCPKNSMERGAWCSTVYRVTKSLIKLKQLYIYIYIYIHTHTHTYICTCVYIHTYS